jgi:hypothetical protein
MSARGNVMSNKAELIQARARMMAVLDTKFKDVPEWQAFRAMDAFITAMDAPTGVTNGAGESPVLRTRKAPSYGDLGLEAVQQAGKPLSTREIVAFIATRRNRTPDSIKPNVQAALSRDDRLDSVTWSGGRGWWFKDREVPERAS